MEFPTVPVNSSGPGGGHTSGVPAAPHPGGPAGRPGAGDNPPPAPPPSAATPKPGDKRREILVALGIVGFLTVMGFPLGAVWALAVPRVELVHVDGGWAFTEENPEQYVAADGFFALGGLVLGIAAALIVWFALRRWRGPWVLAGLVLGAIGCQVAQWRFGRIGRDAYQASLDSVPVGWHVWRSPELLMTDFNPVEAFHSLTQGHYSDMMSHLALGVLATMAFTAAFTYTVLAGWSKFTTLRRHEEPAEDADQLGNTDPSGASAHNPPPRMQNVTASSGLGRLPS